MTPNRPVTDRDDELGRLLRELDVPDHAPGFHQLLEHDLRAHRRRRARRERTTLRWGIRLGLAACLAAGALLLIGLPQSARTPTTVELELARAAEVKARVRASLATVHDLSGELVSKGSGGRNSQRWRFTLSSSGDLRLEGPHDGEVITYDASAAIARSAQRSASTGAPELFYAERSGVAPGPPDAGPPTSILPRQLGAYVRALLAAKDPRVRDTVFEGRRAWRLDVDVVPNAIAPEFSGDRLELVVDRRSGIPVRVVERKGRTFLRELRIDHLVVNGPLPSDAFRLRFPDGAEVSRTDEGFRRTGLHDIHDLVGYAPLVPGWTPPGFKLADIAVAAEAAPTGAEAGNPPSRMVVSLSYRRGLEQFLVTTRLAGKQTWSDPLATGEGFPDQPASVVVRGGALDGVRANLVIAARGIPHVWARTDDLVVTVGGDLGSAELIRVCESLRARPG